MDIDSRMPVNLESGLLLGSSLKMNPESIIFYVRNNEFRSTSGTDSSILGLSAGVDDRVKGVENILFTKWIIAKSSSEGNVYIYDLLDGPAQVLRTKTKRFLTVTPIQGKH